MPDTSLRVTATINATPAVVFDLLASPHRHHELDASGMVGADEEDTPITKVGQVFRMNMTFRADDGKVTDYQTDNHITAFEPNRVIAWSVAPVDGEPLGWTWRYELAPKKKNDEKTKVALVYDWTGITEESKKQYGVPAFDEDDLDASLSLLKKALDQG